MDACVGTLGFRLVDRYRQARLGSKPGHQPPTHPHTGDSFTCLTLSQFFCLFWPVMVVKKEGARHLTTCHDHEWHLYTFLIELRGLMTWHAIGLFIIWRDGEVLLRGEKIKSATWEKRLDSRRSGLVNFMINVEMYHSHYSISENWRKKSGELVILLKKKVK